jgi:integrase
MLPVPRKTPLAWSRDELEKLLTACGSQVGFVGHVPASWWWVSLHLALWDTGERIGALIQCRWEWLNEGWLVMPAEVRKGKVADMTYHLSAETLEAIETIRRPHRDLIWEWPFAPTYLWYAYRKIRKRAGMAADRRSSFHRMRRSVASHYEAAGGNATELLGHSDRKLTKASYLDPRYARQPQAQDRLFRLNPHNREPPPGASA